MATVANQQRQLFALSRELSDGGICRDEINCFCGDLAVNQESVIASSLFIRLGCQCVLHYHCLVQYLHYKIDDRLTMSLNGISCPFGSSCKTYHTLQEVNNDESKIYYITVEDLDNIVDYCSMQHPNLKRYLAENDYEELSHEKVASLRKWIADEMEVKVPPPVAVGDDNLYILATTKACPSCKFPSTHFHHHACHHISPARPPKRAGCLNCHVEYCYQCLTTGPENQRHRGSASICNCGSWSRFCDSISDIEDVNRWVAVKHGVPYDKRCGCVFCTDCRFGKKCDLCDGTCAVCRGLLQPSPLMATKDQSKLLPAMYGGRIPVETHRQANGVAVNGADLHTPMRRRLFNGALNPAAPPLGDRQVEHQVDHRQVAPPVETTAQEVANWLNSKLLLLQSQLLVAYGWYSIIMYAYYFMSGCTWLLYAFFHWRVGLMGGFGPARIIWLAAVCSFALKLSPLRNNHYFFAWPVVEDLWLFLLTVIAPPQAWKLWLTLLPLLMVKYMCVIQIIMHVLPSMFTPPRSEGIFDSEDYRVLILLIPTFIVSSALIAYNRQCNNFRDYIYHSFNVEERHIWLMLPALEASIGLGVLFSMSWFYIIITLSLFAFISFSSNVRYDVGPIIGLVILGLVILGFFNMAANFNHVRHYLYVHYLQQILSPWVIHALDFTACFGIMRLDYVFNGGNNKFLVGGHLLIWKFVDLLHDIPSLPWLLLIVLESVWWLLLKVLESVWWLLLIVLESVLLRGNISGFIGFIALICFILYDVAKRHR